MNLLIDIGNTSCKLAYQEEGRIINVVRAPHEDNIPEALESQPQSTGFDTIVLCTVRTRKHLLEYFLRTRCSRFIIFDLDYVKEHLLDKYRVMNGMPEGMGADRLAAILAANHLYPDTDLLVFDFGTATTVEFISSCNEYEGGSISLGLYSRYRALNLITDGIPLIHPKEFLDSGRELSTIGYDLHSALAAGNILGIEFEIEGYIARHPHRKVVMTGGDAPLIASLLKTEVILEDDLVLIGLAQIIKDEQNA